MGNNDNPEFQKYFDFEIEEAKKLEHKGNNQLFKIKLKNGLVFLAKRYSRIHMDNWERGKTEFKTLEFLWKLGFREIPEPVKFDENENIGIYSFEKGKILDNKEVTEKGILKLADFLVKLHNLPDKDKQNFSPASSACLCLKEYLNVIDRRLEKIMNYEPDDENGKKAKEFLEKEVCPKINRIKEKFYENLKNFGWENSLEKELPISEQVLTPADFGFHNVLFSENKDDKNECKFLDFEYFGRDDPARQILDFLHHAKSEGISKELKELFLAEYVKKRNLPEKFFERIKLLEPLIAVTWVLIRLNILSKSQLEHIKFAYGDTKNVIEERLAAAKKKLREIE